MSGGLEFFLVILIARVSRLSKTEQAGEQERLQGISTAAGSLIRLIS
jgi:hypothetical protein